MVTILLLLAVFAIALAVVVYRRSDTTYVDPTVRMKAEVALHAASTNRRLDQTKREISQASELRRQMMLAEMEAKRAGDQRAQSR